MAQVEITINAKSYRIACEDGQEERLRELASLVDAHVKELVDDVGQIGDTRLLVMASILIADELADLREATAGGSVAPGGADEERLAASLEALAGRIDTIAERLRAS